MCTSSSDQEKKKSHFIQTRTFNPYSHVQLKSPLIHTLNVYIYSEDDNVCLRDEEVHRRTNFGAVIPTNDLTETRGHGLFNGPELNSKHGLYKSNVGVLNNSQPEIPHGYDSIRTKQVPRLKQMFETSECRMSPCPSSRHHNSDRHSPVIPATHYNSNMSTRGKNKKWPYMFEQKGHDHNVMINDVKRTESETRLAEKAVIGRITDTGNNPGHSGPVPANDNNSGDASRIVEYGHMPCQHDMSYIDVPRDCDKAVTRTENNFHINSNGYDQDFQPRDYSYQCSNAYGTMMALPRFRTVQYSHLPLYLDKGSRSLRFHHPNRQNAEFKLSMVYNGNIEVFKHKANRQKDGKYSPVENGNNEQTDPRHTSDTCYETTRPRINQNRPCVTYGVEASVFMRIVESESSKTMDKRHGCDMHVPELGSYFDYLDS